MSHNTTLRILRAIIVASMAVLAGGATAYLSSSHTQAAAAVPAAPQVAGNEATRAEGGRAALDQFSVAFAAAASRVNPSVVAIFNDQEVQVTGLPLRGSHGSERFFGPDWLRQFFPMPFEGSRPRTVHNLGSGVIVSQDGYILTNAHVVRDAKKLTVVTDDNVRHPASIVGMDPQTDVAVIHIEAGALPAAKLGDSDRLQIGQWVLAVGNPMEMMHSVTAGIVSAKGRSTVGIADYEDFIQTDASINPGNSGGALADLDGQVIGINTAIASPSGGSVGIGFAIPINMAREVMDQLIESGRVSRGYLALLPQDVDAQLAKALSLSVERGALAGDVSPGGPAAQAGIERGDVIVSFDGKAVTDSAELRNLVAHATPGSTATVKLVRDGRERQVRVTLGERPESDSGREAPDAGPAEGEHRLGIAVEDPSPQTARRLGYASEAGALVTDVEAGSPAEEAGIRPGDLIQGVNREAVRSSEELRRALAGLPSDGALALLVRRQEHTFFAPIASS